ncbi:hypothetical protein GCM10009530_21710 [Microbispora corallina]|uniref:Cytochrome P450 n=1 Tax=Microbispora corallina TaxID=83302 RepID=A0ABQ4G690_9ACTN|nr:hypothetical protein Mco01_55130 [Microbispora corallina]
MVRHADVRDVLADPLFQVPAVPPGDEDGHEGGHEGGGMAWLRGAVSRFSNGAEHARRRSRAVALLAPLDPAELGGQARAEAEEALARPGRVDVMALLARRVPVGVLAVRLGVPAVRREEAVAAVTAIAAAYHPGGERNAAADAAVASLARLLGGPDRERLAAVAGLLVQACDATAGLIGNTLAAVLRPPGEAAPFKEPAVEAPAVEALLAETMRHDPPVRLTRRVAAQDATVGGVAVPSGAVLVLDLAAANRDPAVFRDPDRFDPGRFGADGLPARDGAGHLGFGSGPRACPGERIALALAAGVVSAALGRTPAETAVTYEPSPNLRVPARLELEECP